MCAYNNNTSTTRFICFNHQDANECVGDTEQCQQASGHTTKKKRGFAARKKSDKAKKT